MADDRATEMMVETHDDDVLTDAALAATALCKRRQFAFLYERYADRLYRYARARTGSATVADDIVSDTMMAALEGLQGFDPARGTFAGWLFTIARRRIADRGRNCARFRKLVERVRSQTPQTHEDDVLDTTIRREDALLARRLLATLPDRDRELVLLRYSAGLNSAEIADALGMTSGAVRTRLSRALQRLATDLAESEDGENDS